jgi:phospholipid transport system substrate-binding protein
MRFDIYRIMTGRSLMGRLGALMLAALLAAAMIPQTAQADDPMTVVKGTVNPALSVLRDKQTPLAQRQSQLRQIVSQTFDFKEMAKSAMGYHWRELSPEQRDEFTNTFITFIEDSYLGKLNDYKGQNVVFVSQRNDGPDYAQVNTQIVQQDKDPVQLNFRLERLGNNNWKVYDVTVDAISIIANYRNQFNRVMNNQGYKTLIADLKSKQEALAASLASH